MGFQYLWKWEAARCRCGVVAWRGVDINPKEGNDNGQQSRPHEDDGWRASTSAHEPLCERVKMREHPNREEHTSKQFTPLGDGAVDLARRADGDRDCVREHDGDGRDHERAPLHNVEVGELVANFVVARFRGEREGDVDACNHLEDALEHGREVRTRAADHPELLVAPPLLERDLGPFHLQEREHAQRERDGEEVDKECDVQLVHDELAGEQGERGQEAVHEEEDGREWIDADVQVRDSL